MNKQLTLNGIKDTCFIPWCVALPDPTCIANACKVHAKNPEYVPTRKMGRIYTDGNTQARIRDYKSKLNQDIYKQAMKENQ